MAKIRVWTRQHRDVLKALEKDGKYTAKMNIILNNEESRLMLHAYKWLLKCHPDLENKPADADFPVWVNFYEEAVTLPSPNTVVLELLIDEEKVTRLNVMKWTALNNMAYIPLDEEDKKRHKALLDFYETSDAKACMTNFYPEIKREVEESWKRLFDDSIDLGNSYSYGLIWEIRREWIVSLKE